MTQTSIRWGLAAVATLLAEIALIALSILCVAVYSYAIHTGETQEFYSAFARVSGPWVSLIAGGPVFFLIARWIRRRVAAAARVSNFAHPLFSRYVSSHRWRPRRGNVWKHLTSIAAGG